MSFENDSIYRHFFSRTDQDYVTDLDLINRYIDLTTNAADTGSLRLDIQKLLDCVAGSTFCPGFEESSHKNQCDDNRSRIEIDFSSLIPQCD